MINVDSQLLDRLDPLIAQTDLAVSAAQREQLTRLVQLMDKWNKAYNLTSVRNPEDMLVRHIMDSIVVAPHVKGRRVIDVGTGPGLPGLPLAIMLPEVEFVLLDSLGKRIRFIRQTAYELGLKNITPVQSRVEQYQPELPLDAVLSRAFASLKDMLHWCQHLVDSKGVFLALKGLYPEEEVAQLPTGFTVHKAQALSVPGLDAQRHLLEIHKT
ncbi:16S rRNA (guanine(527)-N(7))-methyltransferase [Saliniradius amylolyticus]|uniref:Ribosomal RNA small subunit methyltransferase G n=1 Tax=Saliniradius amylolyticus TaxID=2183582 RepID=A0A2S2E731_9ALTE|nr:16S rRNA (guanine(527)-N(7))-methyltransferase RsmG [Saliniradius amylolyticus]AWL13445.1 16S rRNA (guanine(527)-N(7))-methyltransferase [Saliniradius amylolyticus]